MAGIVVCGGGMVGLSAAMMLAADGHRVTVLESDREDVPGSVERAWAAWRRKGVAQFHQPHNVLARFRRVCDAELPGLTDRFVAAGCTWVDYQDTPPPTLVDTAARPGDETRRFVNGRRPVLESVVAEAAGNHPGVEVRRGVRVDALLPGPEAVPGVPHVGGVRTADGTELAADLVVDATGRHGRSTPWLTDLGARAPEVHSQDGGFAYYTRYYTGPALPRRIGRATAALGSISVLTLEGDNDVWSITLFAATADRAMTGVRDHRAFERVVAACPRQAHWLDGRPITDVLPMAGFIDQHRRYVVDDVPVVTGYVAVGDAWACSNPSAGRGLSMGLMHAQALRDTVREHLDDPAELVRAFDRATVETVAPYYWGQVEADRVRLAQMEALRRGETPAAPDPAAARFAIAADHDPDAFRAQLDAILCLATPAEVMARPAVRAAVERCEPEMPPPPPGPDRAELLDLVAG